MTPDQIAARLDPYLDGAALSSAQLAQLSAYLDLLMRWNARTNLTAVRDEESIVSRHFGESLFAARRLLAPHAAIAAADLGSGAGFPGLPLKIWAPRIPITLIESQNKKATFLREVIRALKLDPAEVHAGRAEQLATKFELVTMRAVEKFESALTVAADLVSPGGRLALLIGSDQLSSAESLAGRFSWSQPAEWSKPIPIPLSNSRILLTATNPVLQESNQ